MSVLQKMQRDKYNDHSTSQLIGYINLLMQLLVRKVNVKIFAYIYKLYTVLQQLIILNCFVKYRTLVKLPLINSFNRA